MRERLGTLVCDLNAVLQANCNQANAHEPMSVLDSPLPHIAAVSCRRAQARQDARDGASVWLIVSLVLAGVVILLLCVSTAICLHPQWRRRLLGRLIARRVRKTRSAEEEQPGPGTPSAKLTYEHDDIWSPAVVSDHKGRWHDSSNCPSDGRSEGSSGPSSNPPPRVVPVSHFDEDETKEKLAVPRDVSAGVLVASRSRQDLPTLVADSHRAFLS